LVLGDHADLKWMNAIAFQDQTIIKDFNIIPFLNIKKLEVDYISEKTFSFSTLGPMITYFSEKFMGVQSNN
jgi:hypothetical protein